VSAFNQPPAQPDFVSDSFARVFGHSHNRLSQQCLDSLEIRQCRRHEELNSPV
jgi:hypothetical protein